MSDRVRYLLRYPDEVEYFRLRYGNDVERNARAFMDWVKSLEFFVWTPVICRPEHEEFVTGLLCILYIDGHINISFDNSATSLRNEPGTREELLGWMKRTGWYAPGIKRAKRKK